MKTIFSMLLLAMPLVAFSSPFPEVIVGGCGGCSKVNVDQPATPLAMFVDQPTTLLSHSRVGDIEGPGEPLHINGRILDTSGTPRSGVVIYAFQVSRESPKILAANAEGEPHTLQGWAVSDAQGNYSFDSAIPSDISKRNSMRIHFSIREVGRCVYYIDDLVLAEGIEFAELRQRQAIAARGDSGIVARSKDRNGVWHATRDIKLGLNVPNYERCG